LLARNKAKFLEGGKMARSMTVLQAAAMFAAALVPLAAQRADGCDDAVQLVHNAGGGRVLGAAGYALAETSLISALSDSDPSVRSLAADNLAQRKDRRLIPILMRALSVEKDGCTGEHIRLALQPIVQLHWSQRLEAGEPTSSAQVCASPASALVSLELKQVDPAAWWSYQGLTIEATIRNLSGDPIPYLLSANPRELYTYRVSGPEGRNLDPVPGVDCPNRDCSYTGQLVSSGPIASLYDTKSAALTVLRPLEDVSWYWHVGDDFDMSAPGVYRVSLGAKLGYLDTYVCSNVATVMVK
jgi:hypothetical protein